MEVIKEVPIAVPDEAARAEAQVARGEVKKARAEAEAKGEAEAEAEKIRLGLLVPAFSFFPPPFFTALQSQA